MVMKNLRTELQMENYVTWSNNNCNHSGEFILNLKEKYHIFPRYKAPLKALIFFE